MICTKFMPMKFLGILVISGLYGSCRTLPEKHATENSASTASSKEASFPIGSSRVYFGMIVEGSPGLHMESGKIFPLDEFVMANNKSFVGLQQWEGEPLSCREVEEALIDGASQLDPSHRCLIEAALTGDISSTKSGKALILYAVDKDGNGLPPTNKLPEVPKDLVVHDFADGPPKGINLAVDKEAFIEGARANAERFDTLQEGSYPMYTYGCLRNPRTAQWSDLKAHYYCTFSYKVRFCFSTTLVETRNPVQAIKYCSNKDNEADWKSRKDPEFHRYFPGNSGWDWLQKTPGQMDLFRSIMLSRPESYNVDSANAAINAWYLSVFKSMPLHEARLRRSVDTFPYWRPNQKRYEDIRKRQRPAP